MSGSTLSTSGPGQETPHGALGSTVDRPRQPSTPDLRESPQPVFRLRARAQAEEQNLGLLVPTGESDGRLRHSAVVRRQRVHRRSDESVCAEGDGEWPKHVGVPSSRPPGGSNRAGG